MNAPETALIRYEAMVTAIAECHRVDDVKDIHDKARALEIYARQAMNVDAERKATEIRLRAERRAGELLAATEKAPGGKPMQEAYRSHDATSKAEQKTLSDMGISKSQSSRWQQLAAVPAQQFEDALRDPVKKPTTTGILAAAKPEPKQMDRDALNWWGELRDFERLRRFDRPAQELLACMTETMQADVARIVPMLIEWASQLDLGGSK